jgi:hypothetical protein
VLCIEWYKKKRIAFQRIRIADAVLPNDVLVDGVVADSVLADGILHDDVIFPAANPELERLEYKSVAADSKAKPTNAAVLPVTKELLGQCYF